MRSLATNFLLCMLILTCISCKEESNSTAPEIRCADLPTNFKGVAFSPEGFPATYEKTPEFYSEVDEIGDFDVFVNALWRDSPQSSGNIPEVHMAIMTASDNHCFTPIPSFGWRSGESLSLNHPNNNVNNWTNDNSKQAFIDMLTEFVSNYEPPFLFIGNEINFYYEQNPDDYAHWVAFYEEAYTAVKNAHSDTKMGTIFNFEHISGSGKNVGWNNTYWEAIDQFDSQYLDIIGLTVYPFLSENTPQEIPNTYLNPFTNRDVAEGKPLFITETGWPGDASLDNSRLWSMGEERQVEYLNKLQSVIAGKNVNMINWLFLNEMRNTCNSCNEWTNFGSISLKDSLGNKRPVYNEFVDFSF